MRKALIIATFTSGFMLTLGLCGYAWWHFYVDLKIFQGLPENTIREMENISDPGTLKKLALTLAHNQNELAAEANGLLDNLADLLLAVCYTGFVFVWASVLPALKLFYKGKNINPGWLRWL